MGSTIEWPEGWDPKTGWVNTTSGHLLVSETRDPLSWYGALRRRGTSLAERARLLGGPVPPALWTIEDCRREVQAYFDENGRRPHHHHLG